MGGQQEERLIRYERDGSVTLIAGARRRTIAPGWTDADIDGAAAAFLDEAVAPEEGA